jgi:hypothetical protein
VADRPQLPLARIIGALWPRSALGRAAWVLVPLLGVFLLLAPVAAFLGAALGLVQSLVAPVLASPGGRLLVLNLVVLLAGLLAVRGAGRRFQALRGGLRLRRLVAGIERSAEGSEGEAEILLNRAARSSAPWPATLPLAEVHLVCASARLALRRGDPGLASQLLDGLSVEPLPPELRLVVHHLRIAAIEGLDEVLPGERLRRIQAALTEFPADLGLLRARRAAEHELLDAEAAVATQRCVVAAAPPIERAVEEARLADDLQLCAQQALRRDRVGVALLCAEECVRLRPDDPDAALLHGDALAVTGDVRGALEAWARVDDERSIRRALAAIAQGSSPLRSEDVLRAFPRDGALLLVALLEDSAGRSGRAERARRLAFRLRPDWVGRTDLPTLALASPPR